MVHESLVNRSNAEIRALGRVLMSLLPMVADRFQQAGLRAQPTTVIALDLRPEPSSFFMSLHVGMHLK